MANHNTILVWFRNNLRLHDNEPWSKACLEGDAVIPLFIFDPALFTTLSLGFPKTGSFRTQFLIDSVSELRRALQKKDSELIIRIGKPSEIIKEILKEFFVAKVYTSAAATQEENTATEAVARLVHANKVELHSFHTTTLIHPADLPMDMNQLPEIFTSFRKQVEANLHVRPLFPLPETKPCPSIFPGELPRLSDFQLEPIKSDHRSAITYSGGEDTARERLNEYIWKRELIATYKVTRNELIGSDYSSKLSLALAHGCISAKAIYDEVRKFEQVRIKNESTYWLIFELLWRDYFHFMAIKHGNKIFKAGGLSNKPIKAKQDPASFEQWRLGNTGNDFVDANMRELLHTGFMSNRGRQNVASYLVHDLHLDWRWGAAWFESQLIDYDPCSNWLNWAYVAGVGNDPRENRYFNTRSQAERYDSEGAYRKLWLNN